MKTKFLAVGILLIMMISCTKTPQVALPGGHPAIRIAGFSVVDNSL